MGDSVAAAKNQREEAKDKEFILCKLLSLPLRRRGGPVAQGWVRCGGDPCRRLVVGSLTSLWLENERLAWIFPVVDASAGAEATV